MDHHGTLSHLEGVAVRAYRDHFGERKDNPLFVVTGTADADATFAIAALAGVLPDRSIVDLLPLARLINAEDIDPFGADLMASRNGAIILAWKQQMSLKNDALAYSGGVDRWRVLTTRTDVEAILEAARSAEQRRRDEVDAFPLEVFSEHVAFFAAPSIDFGNLYRRFPVLIGLNESEWKIRIVASHVRTGVT